MTSHADGTIVVWNKDREDWAGFVPRPPHATRSPSGTENEGGAEAMEEEGKPTRVSSGSPTRTGDIVVTRPAAVDKKGVGTSKFNPVRHWRVSNKAVTGGHELDRSAWTFTDELGRSFRILA